jgi:hypothetical protein
LAFDAAQGRLWVVCRSCTKWNLVPFDTRLETIDACERIFRDTRTRFSTDHIGLARARDGMDLVRIGAPQRPEFASWRFGSQYRRRRRQTIAISSAGAAAGVAVLFGMHTLGALSVGMVGSFWQVPRLGWQAAQDYRRRVWVKLPDLAKPSKLRRSQLESAHLDMSGREMQLRFRHPGVLRGKSSPVTVAGPEVRLLMRRITAALNDTAGSTTHLTDAIHRLESGRMEEWLRQSANEAQVTKPGRNRMDGDPKDRWEGFGSPALRLRGLQSSDRLAVEMWLSEEDEAKALAGELALLERQWKEAEQLAKIADSLAVSDDVERDSRLSS